MVKIYAEGRRQMDRLKTLLMKHDLVCHQVGIPMWKFDHNDSRILQNAYSEYDDAMCQTVPTWSMA